MCRKHTSKEAVEMITEGLWFNEESKDVDNAHIRMLFLDVLTRRFLLRSTTVLAMIRQDAHSRNQDTLVRFLMADFEQYGDELPQWAESCEYMKDREHWVKLEQQIITGL